MLLGALAIATPRISDAMDLTTIDDEPLTLSGWIRFRDYTWSYFNAGPVPSAFGNDNQYNYPALVARLGIGYQLDGVKLFVEGMNPTFFGLPDDAIAPAPKGALGLGANYYSVRKESFDSSVFLKQGYVEFGGQILKDLAVKGGRFEFFDGKDLPVEDRQIQWITDNRVAQRLIGNFGWSDVMRSFDGAQVGYGGQNWRALVFYGVPTRGVFDLNGMDEISAVDVIYAALSGFRTDGAWGNSLGRVFYIWYDDNRGLVPVDNEPASSAKKNLRSISIDTIGADFVHDVKLGPGTADFMVWGAYQFGNWGDQTQAAYAATAEAGYRFDDVPWTPWLRLGYDMASGDNNPNNGVHGTFFQILPTPRIYALDPIYNMMNSTDVLGELIIFPTADINLRTTLHGLWLSSNRDLWYYGGGAFDSHLFGYVGRPSLGNSYLGSVLDTSLTWNANRYLTFNLYGGHMFGGSVVAADFPNGREETFGYMEAVCQF
jgi:hypothetical protein